MRLSEKGLDKVYGLEFEDVEFDQEDFTGVVILTVDEAKALLRRIPEFKENGDWQLPIERLKERITKAEKCNEIK